MYGYILLYVI